MPPRQAAWGEKRPVGSWPTQAHFLKRRGWGYSHPSKSYVFLIEEITIDSGCLTIKSMHDPKVSLQKVLQSEQKF